MEDNFYSKFKKPIAYIILLLIVGGVFTYTKIHDSLFPQITFPKIKVIANNGEQPVNKMMVTVTKPLEDAIKQVPGLRMIRSTTSRGSAEISAYLTWKANINISLEMLQLRVNEVQNQLPAGTQLTVEKMNPSVLPVMGFILESPDKGLIDLKTIAKYTVKPYLSQLSGISRIQIQGGKNKEYWLELKPHKMSRLGVTPMMIRDSLATTNFIRSNGYVSDYRRLYLTLTNAGSYSVQNLRNIVIKNDGKSVVRLKDIANIKVHQQIQYVKIYADGKQGVLVNVIKQPNQNLIALSNEVMAKVKDLKHILPSDVTIKPYYDRATFVHEGIHSVSDAIWIGLLFAILITIIFLRSLDASVTMLITIPTTLAISLIVLYAVGYTLNLMTLGGIAAAISLIIDDAIIVVEQIHRIWEEFPEERPTFHVKKAIEYLFPAMVGSSLSTIVIFLPFSLMSGVAGAYFKILAYTMIITLVSSFFVVWLALPVIYLVTSRKHPRPSRTKHSTEIAAWSRFFVGHPSITILFIIALGLATWYMIPRLKSGFLPHMDEGTIVLDYVSPPGTSLQETNYLLTQVDSIVTHTPQVANYSRRTGTQLGFFITEPNTGDYLIQLKNKRHLTTDQVIAILRKKIESQEPALQVDFGQVISDNLGDLMGSAQPIEIKVFGENPTRLKKYAKQIANVISHVRGTADVFDGITIAGPSIQIIPKYKNLAFYHLSPDNLRFQLKTQIDGDVVSHVLEKEQMTNVRMIYPNKIRNDVAKLKNTSIFLPDGRLKPVSEFAKIKVKTGSAEIDRENLQPLLMVTARLQGRDLGSTITAIKKAISSKVYLAKGYHIEYGGAYAQQQKSFKQLLMILLAASLLVFTVILFLFKDIKSSIIIFFVSILGIAGCIMALYFTGTPLDVGSYTGIIMIVGIIGENAIFTYYLFAKARENMDMEDAIHYSISLRLRPKVMTATAAITALMPLALAIGTGAQMHQPLAIAVIGGLVMALPLLLIVLPTLLRLVHKWEIKMIGKE